MELDFRKNPQVLSTIIDAMAPAVFTVDVYGRFVAWSQGAERITGYSDDEVRGQECTLLEGPNCKGFGKIQEVLADPPLDDGAVCNQECRIVAKDGRELSILGSLRLIRQSDGSLCGAVGTFSDATALVLAHEKIALLEQQDATTHQFARLLGQSPAMKEVFRQLRLAAESDVTVVITGESGTGKELAARAIHAHSGRREKPLLAINCSAIPESLLEGELFGYAKGAFTGATATKPGLIESADGGTLFLDEIGEVSQAIQVKLLRFLQEREIRRIGESQTRPVNVRLMTATNKNLRELVSAGLIREDFYYRIHVYEVRMPALRERKEDIPLLTEHFMRMFRQESGRPIDSINRDALQLLGSYPWPGNIRQLRNAIEHAFVTAEGNTIAYLDLPLEIRDPAGCQPRAPTGLSDEAEAERERIVQALRKTGGNRTRAAKLLGISRVTLWKKTKLYRLDDVVPTTSGVSSGSASSA